jgi:hypothetical protein
MSLLSLSNTTGTIERATTTPTTLGGHSASYAAVYSDIPGAFQPIRGARVEHFARMGIDVDHVFYTSTPIVTRSGDRLLVGSTYYPIGHSEDMGGRGRAYAIYVKQLD